jgi:hypothetical protein
MALPMSLGASQEWSAAVYGPQSQSTIEYLQNQFTNITQPLSAFGKEFVQSSLRAFQQFNNSEAMRFARNVINRLQGNVIVDTIAMLVTAEHFQNALPMMQRFTMACPSVRTAYHRQMCDGYSETYHDHEPGKIREDHYDYRRVMNGIVTFEGEERCATYTTWQEELHEGDQELQFDQQTTVLDGWDHLDVMMVLGQDDPTAKGGGKL